MSYYKIFFVKDGTRTMMQTTSDIMIAQLIVHYANKIGLKNTNGIHFVYNSLKLDPNSYKSLKELNIPNEASIKVVPAAQILNYSIIFNLEGKNTTIHATSNMKFSELVSRFKNKIMAKDDNKLLFIYKSQRIHEDESRTLAELGLLDQSIIEVTIISLIIGK